MKWKWTSVQCCYVFHNAYELDRSLFLLDVFKMHFFSSIYLTVQILVLFISEANHNIKEISPVCIITFLRVFLDNNRRPNKTFLISFVSLEKNII